VTVEVDRSRRNPVVVAIVDFCEIPPAFQGLTLFCDIRECSVNIRKRLPRGQVAKSAAARRVLTSPQEAIFGIRLPMQCRLHYS
jgi:hypothetical protein